MSLDARIIVQALFTVAPVCFFDYFIFCFCFTWKIRFATGLSLEQQKFPSAGLPRFFFVLNKFFFICLFDAF